MNISTNKLYAFSKPINCFLETNFNTHINIYAKSLDVRVLAANSTLLEDMGHTKLQEILGASMYDIFNCPLNAKSIISNDIETVNKKSPVFFVESATHLKIKKHQQYFSIKTTLNNSANHIIGSFGLSCRVNSTSLSQLLRIINKLKLMPSPNMPFAKTMPILKNHFFMLTKREQECAYYLTKCMTYKEIAKQMGIAPRTVETHIEHIKNKLDCYNRSDIVNKVFEWKPDNL